MTDIPRHGLQLTSNVTAAGEIELSLAETPVRAPGPGEVLVRIEAAPINPSDIGLLLGPADARQAREVGSPGAPRTLIPLPPAAASRLAARVNRPASTGIEGAGVVIAAGGEAEHLIGRTVAAMGQAMFAEYCTLRAQDGLLLPEGVTPVEAADCFVNPLTALGMVETMRLEGHKALVHTAAASNLGQMLVKLCQADGVPLVNIVRRPEQAELLRGLGAVHVCDSSAPSFRDDLLAAVRATGATLGFDAIGGGWTASHILSAMEAALNPGADLYGSGVHKQVYLYGALDSSPTELARDFGMAWGVGGWLLIPLLLRLGADGVGRLRERVAAEIRTTFASRFTAEISLQEALKPEVIQAYARRATGEKHLINPSRR